jgi:hypothetical protein
MKKNKTAIAIAIFFAFSMTASMMLVPSTHAANTLTVYAYINAAPNPVGTGQKVEIIMWVQVIFGQNAQLTNNYRFHNYKLTITDPNDKTTTETFTTVSDPTSAQPYYFTPDTVGTYTLTFDFPETTITADNDPDSALIGSTYTSATASTTLTVQEEPVAAIPQTPLPTSYWTRPIYGVNSAWYTVGSNWLGFGSPGYISIAGGPNLGANGEQFGPTTNVGPLTSHIMWTKPMTSGGIVGQTATTIPGNSYAEGSAYDQKFTNPIIVDGMLIYTEDISQTLPASGPTVCVNLRTGQQIWSSTSMPQPSFAYIYDAEDPNQHGVWPPMLVAASGSTWRFFDAYTATPLFNVTHIPGQGFFGPAANTATMLGPEGEYLMVLLTNYGNSTNPNWYLQEWNSSRLWDNWYSGPSTTPDIPPPITDGSWTGGNVTTYGMFGPTTTYLESLYDYNVSLPWLNTATLNDAPIGSMTVLGSIQGDMVLAYAGNFPSEGNQFFGVPSSAPYETFGINLNAASASMGAELWHNTLQAPANNLTVTWGCLDPVNNVFVLEYRETMQMIGFSLTDGKQIWGPTAGQAPLDYYGSQASGSLAITTAYGKIYSSAYAGIVYCYDTTNGTLLWTFGNGNTPDNSTDSGLETPFGHYPTFVNAIGSGVVYTITSEHTEETPIFKGALARALNATTGKQIWALSSYTGEFFTGSYAIADGYATWFNGYDNQIYSVGRGPSATTVSVPHAGLAFGQSVVISGTVMDIAAGTKQDQQAANFPNGVPVSSDASMTDWMGYVYQQQPCPVNFTGVPVTISVLDSNGNSYTIGTTMTDGSGTYRLTYTPTIAGNFTVYASFDGTNGYWPSAAEDGFTVMQEPTATAPPTPPPASLADIYFLPMSIVILIAIIVTAIVMVLMLRKR